MIKSLVGVSVIAGLLALWVSYLLVSIGEEREQCNTRVATIAAEAQKLRADAIEEERRQAEEQFRQLQASLDAERQRRFERERQADERERELLATIDNFETQEAVAWSQVKIPVEVLQSH